jgi:Ser/Thr protein kinase RdoA (MazF antagonist)
MAFENLTPDTMLNAVEQVMGIRLTGLTIPFPSYINRVYELRAVDETKLIAKFYRPGRWSLEALEDEHRFLADCRETEIPVVAPLPLADGNTLGTHEGIHFAVFPKRAGRRLEIVEDSQWVRLGSLVARMHLAGQKRPAPSRVTIHPQVSTIADIEYLHEHIIPSPYNEQYRTIALRIVDVSTQLFEGAEKIRIHGDCHRGNILDRLDEGLLLIDFDDMAMGPPVQDLWLLLPERANKARREIELILSGYERFRRFDRAALRCIEPLRAMRMIYFLAWTSRQVDDFQFRKNFPDWGSSGFWQREINDLREQFAYMLEGD